MHEHGNTISFLSNLYLESCPCKRFNIDSCYSKNSNTAILTIHGMMKSNQINYIVFIIANSWQKSAAYKFIIFFFISNVKTSIDLCSIIRNFVRIAIYVDEKHMNLIMIKKPIQCKKCGL